MMARRNEISGLQVHLGYWLRYVSNHVSHEFSRKVEGQGVTVAEWVVLRALFDAESLNPSQVAEQLGMTRGAISKLMERLCQKKFVTRQADVADGRFQTIALTPAGRKLVPRLARLADENDRQFFGHLGVKEREALTALLRDCVERHGWKDLPIK
jgi:DNA-binding MarR family transcriptional regulator